MDRTLIDVFRNNIIKLTDKDEEIFKSIINDLLQHVYIMDGYTSDKNAIFWLETISNAQLVKYYFQIIDIDFYFDKRLSVAYIKNNNSKSLKYTVEQSKIFFAIALLYQNKKNCASEIKDFKIRYSEIKEHLIVTVGLGQDNRKIKESILKETLKLMKSQNLVQFYLKDIDEEDCTIELLKTLEFVFSDDDLDEFYKVILEQTEKGDVTDGNN